jgi:serine/threonine-protein kinase RsbW
MSEFATNVLATPEAITRLVDDVLDFLQREKVDPRATHHVALIIEEVLTNLGTHGGCRDVPARLAISVEPARVKGVVIDRGPAFDPRTAPAPHLDAEPDERKLGGIGLHLVRNLSTIEYSYRNGENCMTFYVTRAS